MTTSKERLTRTTIYLPKKLQRDFKVFCILNNTCTSQRLIQLMQTDMINTPAADESTKKAEAYVEKFEL